MRIIKVDKDVSGNVNVDTNKDKNVDENKIDKDAKYGAVNRLHQLYNTDNMSLINQMLSQRNRKEILQKSRGYVNKIGILNTIIKLKTSFVASGFKITHPEDKIERYYNDLYDELDIDDFIRAASDELQITGEFYKLKSYDGNDPVNLSLLNPEKTDVRSVLGQDIIYLEPNDDIRKMLNSSNPEEVKLAKKYIPPGIAKKWKQGKKAVIPEELVERYYLTKPDFKKHPNSPIEPIMKDLELLSTLIDADYSNATKLKSILQAKVGDKDVGQNGIMPPEAIDKVDELLDNPNSSALEIVTQWFVDLEYVSPDSSVFDDTKYKSVLQRIVDWSNIGVFIQGGGSYAQSFVKLKALRQNVENIRSIIKKSLNDFNKEVAKKQGFKTYNGYKTPEITFDSNSMIDDSHLLKVTKWLHQQGLLSVEDTLETFDFDVDVQQKKKEKEQEKWGDMDDNIWKPLFEASQSLLDEENDVDNTRKNDEGNSDEPRKDN